MHAGRSYTISEIVLWTRRETLVFILLASIPLVVHVAGVDLPAIPWQPVAVLGTAVAFVTGFKSNAAYGRLWEARKIWGAIVNASRSWAVLARDYVAAEPSVHRRLVYRHIAWLTALRHQLRAPRAWETTSLKHAREYQEKTFVIPERAVELEDELAQFLSPEDLKYVMAKKNRASAIIALQSADLREHVVGGGLTEFRQVELGRLLTELYTQQGKSERIKNFPYPRQFATLNLRFIWLFIIMLPFAMFSEFLKYGESWAALTIPTTVVVAWVFHTMDKIGSASENPFEGGPNDVPITAMTRGIEIDLRELAEETDLPKPHQAVRNILM